MRVGLRAAPTGRVTRGLLSRKGYSEKQSPDGENAELKINGWEEPVEVKTPHHLSAERSDFET